MSQKIIVIATSHADLAGEPNGTYAPELTHALHALEEAGLPYDLVSVKGGQIPTYGDDADDLTKKMLADPAFRERLDNTASIESVDADAYDAVFYPGGYGLLFDLVENPASHRIIGSIYERGGVVSAVCHGPAVLSDVTLSDGTRLVEGRNITGFAREEEVAMSTLDKIPFVLEERLMEAGAVYRKVRAWQSLVVSDGRLITGQNPPSAAGVGQALAEALASSASK